MWAIAMPVDQQTWRARVRRFESGRYGRALRSPPQAEERADVELFRALFEQLPGAVKLNDPQHTLFILSGPFVSSDGEEISVLLARQLCGGLDLTPYALPQRRFLSTTTMDHEAAFVMANLAQIKPGMSILDPYAGEACSM